MINREKLQEGLDQLLATLKRRIQEQYDKDHPENVIGTDDGSYYICEDCNIVVEAITEGETPTCPECGGSVAEQTPEPTKE